MRRVKWVELSHIGVCRCRTKFLYSMSTMHWRWRATDRRAPFEQYTHSTAFVSCWCSLWPVGFFHEASIVCACGNQSKLHTCRGLQDLTLVRFWWTKSGRIEHQLFFKKKSGSPKSTLGDESLKNSLDIFSTNFMVGDILIKLCNIVEKWLVI